MQKDLFDNQDAPSPPAGPLMAGQGCQIIQVAFENAGDQVYDYGLPDHLTGQCQAGRRVRVPFGRSNKETTGFCVAVLERGGHARVKLVRELVDEPALLTDVMLELARWIAQYYCCPLGVVLSAMVPAAVKQNVGLVKRSFVRLTEAGRNFQPAGVESCRTSSKGRAILEHLLKHYGRPDEAIPLDDLAVEVGATRAPFQTLTKAGLLEIFRQSELELPASADLTPFEPAGDPFELNDRQQQAIAAINAAVDRGGFSPFLLHGVTGSGKTEVYMACIEHVIGQGGQAIVLVPEIALTPQTEARFLRRFGRVALLHSGMSSKARHQQWRWIAEGGVQVVVGARSAIFAPLQRPGLIVVDEEHEPSYKQDKAPRYHGRDVAIKRAQLHNIPIVLGSATPSLETVYNSRTRPQFTVVTLPHRVKDLPLPKVLRVNMREEARQRKGQHLLSLLLEEQLRLCVAAGHQAILFLNRRGHSNYIYCPSCQYIHTCPNCSVNLTYHRQTSEFEQELHRMMMCHYCQHSCRVPRVCPLCKGKLILIGPGTQKAEDELNEKFPRLRVRRADSDSINPGDYAGLLGEFGAGRIDVLLGTQMIGKGLDFPNVALVGVLSADLALALPDFRSAERTFQLIAQVAGRCGRARDNGVVVVQSFLPDEPSVAMACRHDFTRFAEMELATRQRCQMPPCHRMARIILRDEKLEKVQEESKRLRLILDQACQQLDLAVELRGPVPASLARLESYHRYEILLKSAAPAALQRLLGAVRGSILTDCKVQAAVDMDPVNLM